MYRIRRRARCAVFGHAGAPAVRRQWRQCASDRSTHAAPMPAHADAIHASRTGQNHSHEARIFPGKQVLLAQATQTLRLAATRPLFLNNLVLTIDYAAPNLPALFQPPVSEQRLYLWSKHELSVATQWKRCTHFASSKRSRPCTWLARDERPSFTARATTACAAVDRTRSARAVCAWRELRSTRGSASFHPRKSRGAMER